MATYWGSSITMGTWLLGLNTPYHHSIKKYGERGRLVVKETEFRSSLRERLGKRKCCLEFKTNATPNPGPAGIAMHSLTVQILWAVLYVCVCVGGNFLSILAT